MAKLSSTDISGNLSLRGKLLTDLFIEKELPRLIISHDGTDSPTLHSGIEFKHINNQNVIIEHNTHDSNRSPFGLHIKRSPSNSDTSTNKAYLDVEGKIYTQGQEVYHTGRKPTHSDVGAAPASHSHSYLPLTGGTLTGDIIVNGNITIGIGAKNIICPNNYGIQGKDTSGNGHYMLFMRTDNVISLGFNSRRVDIDDLSLTVKGNRVYHAGFKPTWNDIQSKPSTFAPIIGSASNQAAAGNHLHDDRYYTESEMNTKLNEKVNTSDYTLTTIKKTLTVSTSWIDTGIAGTNLATGSYMVQIYVNHSGNGFYSEHFTGIMSWYSSGTNSSDVSEIVLHSAGHSIGGKSIFLRFTRVAGNVLGKLQISASHSLSSMEYQFKFRRLI